MDMQSKRFFVLSDGMIVNKQIYVNRIWKPALMASKNIGSVASWLDALTLIYDYDGQIFWRSGNPYEIPEIDTVFDSHRNRWMCDFLKAVDEQNTWPNRFSTKIERLRQIALYCDIERALLAELVRN